MNGKNTRKRGWRRKRNYQNEKKDLKNLHLEKTTQEDRVQADESQYCRYYKKIKDTIVREGYLEEKETSAEEKRLWARARCGNTWRGQKNPKDAKKKPKL